MIPDVDGLEDIRAETRRLLKTADAFGRFPTPVDDIVAAARLTEPDTSVLDPGLLARAPARIRRLVSSVTGRVRGLLDRREREIHVDPEIAHTARGKFVRLHETSHHAFPWQRELGYADDDLTLSPSVRELFERQASQGAAELLFQNEGFSEMLAEFGTGIAAVTEGANVFGASLRASLRRYASGHRGEVLALVLDGRPWESPLGPRFRRREAVASPAFARRFASLPHRRWLTPAHGTLFELAVAASCGSTRLQDGEWVLTDQRGKPVKLRVEALFTGYNVLLLAWTPTRELTRRRLRLSVSA